MCDDDSFICPSIVGQGLRNYVLGGRKGGICETASTVCRLEHEHTAILRRGRKIAEIMLMA